MTHAAKTPENLRTWAAPEGVARNGSFHVRVREHDDCWRTLFVHTLKVGCCHFGGPFDASMVYFDFAGTVTLEVTYAGTLETFEFRPASFGIAAAKNGNTLTFDITQDREFPRKFVLRINDDWSTECLHIFTNPPEEVQPQPAEVDHYFGPGPVHEIGTLDLSGTAGKIVYIAGGAIVRGSIRMDGTANARIHGRGQFDGIIRSARDARNITLDGFVMTSSTWAIVFDHERGWEGSGPTDISITNLALVTHAPKSNSCPDGIHLDAAVECRCKGCFVRASDDVLNVDARYGRQDMGRIRFENMVLWSDRGHCMMVGYKGTPANNETIHDVVFRNIDVINNRGDAHFPEAVMQINCADNLTIRDIRFEDIRVMAFQQQAGAQLLSIDMRMNHWSDRVNGLAVRNITCRNISYDGDGEAPGEIIGKPPRRCVDGVQFINWSRRGRLAATLADANMIANDHVRNLRFGDADATEMSSVEFALPENLRGSIPYSAAARTTGPIWLNFTAPETVDAGSPFAICEIRALKGNLIGGVLRYRWGTPQKCACLPLQPLADGRFRVTIPGEHTVQPFDYCLEGSCADGTTLTEPADGVLVKVRPDAEPPSLVGAFEPMWVRSRSVTVRWCPASDDSRATGYELFLRTQDGANEKIAHLPPEELTFTCGTVCAGQILELGVRGVDAVGRTGLTQWVRMALPETEDTPPLPVLHLSDLTAVRETTGWGRVEKDRNGIRNPQPLRLRGVEYRKGLGVHADSEIVYRLEPDCTRFVAWVGIDDVQLGNARILARVFADDVLLGQSPVLGKEDPPWPFNVAIPPGARQLRLIIRDGYDGIPCAVADWVDVGFVTTRAGISAG